MATVDKYLLTLQYKKGVIIYKSNGVRGCLHKTWVNENSPLFFKQ